jgi:tRNA pseudouridine55 synthase
VIDGFLVVDKPSGITSHDVVAILRRTLKQKKIGHTGTLDPFATGVLPIALGEGTKAIPFLDEASKEYQAVMQLGVATDTLDLTGNIVAEQDTSQLTAAMVHAVIPAFTGKLLQLPPMFSAIKQGGVPLYKLARKGETVERKEREVVIHSLVIDRIALPEVTFTVRCSRGTYIRTLADDIGQALGVGAHLTALRRTASGLFTLKDAVTLAETSSAEPDKLLHSKLISINKALAHLPELPLTEFGCKRLRNGIAPVHDDIEPVGGKLPAAGMVRLLYADQLQAVGDILPSGGGGALFTMKLCRVFNPLSPLHAPI